MQSKQRDSLQRAGVILYNSLPAGVRNITGEVSDFMVIFDLLLETLPDQPAVPGFVPGARTLYGKPSNSIDDWMRIIDTSSFNQLLTSDDNK